MTDKKKKIRYEDLDIKYDDSDFNYKPLPEIIKILNIKLEHRINADKNKKFIDYKNEIQQIFDSM